LQRYAQIGEAPPLPEEPFELLYVDPPWRMGSPDSADAPEQHYPTLPLDEIKAIEIPAAENAVLFLWAVNSLLPEALETMGAWGFTFKTNLSWVKGSIGLGNWFRNQHELLLFGCRGTVSPPEPSDRVSSVIQAPAGRHSAKPHLVYELIERCFPHMSKVELFARGTPRPGWTAWGNEVTQ
jgi:N6-adenosine-specific RNA methylase IME4